MKKRPLHSKIRRFLSKILYSFLGSIIKIKYKYDKIEIKEINRILITRLNHRVGNILFLTPLIKALEKRLPHAQVDLLLGADFSGLIGQMANVNKVYYANAQSIKSPGKLISLIKELNKNNYDLLICPTKGSGSSNISQALIKAKYKLGFKPENFINFVNVSVDIPDTRHTALFPLALMNAFAGEKLTYEPYLDISLSDDEKNKGKELLSQLIGQENVDNKTVIGIFRAARYEKRLPDSYWLEYVNRLLKVGNDCIIVDVLGLGDQPVTDQIASIDIKTPRQLACFLSALDYLITLDSGPMHLAGAAGANVIALFNQTPPDIYGPLGKNDHVIDLNTKNIDEVFAETTDILNK